MKRSVPLRVLGKKEKNKKHKKVSNAVAKDEKKNCSGKKQEKKQKLQ